MTDYDIHSCGYYCNRPACIEAQRNELRDKLFPEPTIDGWPLWSGLPQPEPIAYINVEERKLEWATPIKWETPTVVLMGRVPLYTKKEWVGLTEDDIKDIEGWVEFKEAGSNERVPLGKLALYISQKIREKNT
jgi:hypothetical protein